MLNEIQRNKNYFIKLLEANKDVPQEIKVYKWGEEMKSVEVG